MVLLEEILAMVGGESNIAIGVLFGDGGGGCRFSDELCVLPGCIGACCPQ